MQKREITRALVSAGVLTGLLSGCGGGGGGTDNAKAPDTVAVTTRVVDGPLANAIVCLDANRNDACDSGEVQGTTDANGNVTLQVAPADVGKYPIVAMICPCPTSPPAARPPRRRPQRSRAWWC